MHGNLNRRQLYVVFSALLALLTAGCMTLQFEGPSDGVWEDLGDPSQGLVAVRAGDRWGYADASGDVAVVPQFAQAQPFSEGKAAVRLTNKWGFINRKGNYVATPSYLDALPFSEGFAAVKTTAGWGYIDSDNHMLIEAQFDEALPFSQGLAAVRIGQRWGYIQSDGQVVIDCRFKAAGKFSNWMAPVAVMKDDNEWGYIDKHGEFLIQPSFDDARGFSENTAAVLVDGFWGFIDKSGAFIVNPRFEAEHDFAGWSAPAKLNGLWGLVDKNGGFTVSPRWAELGAFAASQARAMDRKGRVFLVDGAGYEGELRADRGRIKVAAPVAGSGDREGTVTVRIEVRDHISNAPIAGYSIVSALGSYGEYELPEPAVSDSTGVAKLVIEKGKYDETKLLFGKKEGYFDSPLDVSGHQGSGYVIKTLATNIELPRFNEVVMTRDKTKDASNVLIQQEEFEFKKADKVAIKFDVFAGRFKIRKYFLQQGTKRVESDGPGFELEPGKTFSVDDTIHAGVVTDFRDMPIAMPTLLKIRESAELKKPVEMPKAPAVAPPGNVPFLGGHSGGVQFPLAAFGVEYEDDKITIFVGRTVEGTKKSGSGWEGPFKGFINEVADGRKSFSELMGYYKGLNPKPATSGEGVFKIGTGALGYVELGWDKEGHLEVVGGRVMLFGEFGYEFSGQTMIGVIPVYASFGIGGEVTVTFKAPDHPTGFTDFFKEVTLTVAPYVDCEGGIGIKGLLSIGIALHGTYEMVYEVKPNKFSGELALDMLLRVRALFIFSYEWKLGGVKYHLFGPHAEPGEGSPDETAFPGLDPPEGGLTVEDRSYLDAGPQWLGNLPPPMAAAGGDPLSLQPIKSNILPGSEPLLYQASAGDFLFWVDDAGAGRESLDRTALMFSLQNKDGSWQEGRIVNDDGTADFDFSVIDFKGNLFVAWHNTTKKFGPGSADLDSKKMAEMCKASEILVAVWDQKAGGFGKPARIDTGTAGDYVGKPHLASDGKKLALVYADNPNGDYYLKDGSTSFKSAAWNGNAWASDQYWIRSSGQPIIGWDALVSGGRTYAVTCEDQDGDLKTINDRVVVMTYSEIGMGMPIEHHDNISSAGVNGNPRVIRWRGDNALFWYVGEGDTGRGNIEYYDNVFSRGWPHQKKSVFARNQAFGDDFSLVSAPKKKMAILLVDEDVRLRSVPAMAVYDPERDKWGLPARIAPEKSSAYRAEAPKGLWRSDDRIEVVYRRLPASTQGDGPPPTTLEIAHTFPAPDLVVTQDKVYRYYGQEKGGELLPIRVEVTNKGLAPVKGVLLDIGNNWWEPYIKNVTSGHWRIYKDLELRPGESAVLTVDYRLPASTTASYNLYFVARPLKGKELNTDNNGVSIKFAEPDFALGDINLKRSNFDRRFTVPVENRSPVPLRDVKLTLFDGLDKRGGTVRSFNLDTLDPYKTKTVDFTLNVKDDLEWGNGPRKQLVFEATSTDVNKPGFHSEPFILINPFSLPAFSLAVFDARASGTNYVWANAAAANNHPITRQGKLLIEVCGPNGEVETSYKELVRAEAGRTAILSHLFRVKGNASTYTVRVSMANAANFAPGAKETGGLLEMGGDPVPVEVPVASETR